MLLRIEEYCAKKHGADIERLAADMRQGDADECEDMSLAPLSALSQSFSLSDRGYVAYADNVPVWAFGAGSDGMVWLLGAKGATNYPKTFAVYSRKIVNLFIEEYRRLYNRVPVKYTKTVRWLKWLGAKFGKKEKVNGKEYAWFTLGGE